MAKKRKRQEELKEEREYKPPEFDRREFVKTETGVSKATIIAAIFSMPMGLAAMFVMPVGGFAGGLMAGLAGMGMLWFLLPMLKIDVAPFKPMQWAGIMSTYFLVFLTVWVVLCNPPFNDLASPEIRNVQVSWDDGSTWANVTATSGDNHGVQVPGGQTLKVRAQITDNVRVDTNTIRIARGPQDPVGMSSTGNQYFEAEFTDVANLEYFTITASDTNGHSSTFRFDILPQTAPA